MPKHLNKSILKDFTQRANAARAGGSTVEISHGLPTVAIEHSNGDEYFFQEHEAAALLAEVPPNISEEDYLLAVSQSW